jgi:hypothetical protein
MTVYAADIKAGASLHSMPTAVRMPSGSSAIASRDDLMALASGGLPLWDGVTDIEVRRARPDEEARWRASHAKAIRRGDIEADEQAWIAFLVTLTNPDRRKH